ncbi:MAG TPA: four helix bundle protein [Puia sp.]|jgi:four helix bundle protein|nr:four helix bundle protein [Puia sp.]
MRDYKRYSVWQKAHQLVLFTYKEILPCFPSKEQFSLQSQTKRSVYSIPLNIVEGCGRNSDKDFVHFLDISLGSAQEFEYCILLAFDLGYLNQEKYSAINLMANEVKAMIIGLIKTIRK